MRKTVPIEERYWALVDRSGGPEACWPWLGLRWKDGYGQFSIAKRTTRATHYAVALDGRVLAAGQVVAHSCDNPPCVNPRHLVIGTQSENLRGGVARGRPIGQYARTAEVRARQSASIKATFAAHPESAWMHHRTHCRQGHPYVEANLYWTGGRRRCRRCSLDQQRRARQRRAS